MKRIFPIDTATACQFKWTWSSLYLPKGTTNSCHRCQHWKIDHNKFGDFHNLPDKLKDRENMLNGKWPGNGCEYCKSVEDAGGQSERLAYTNTMDLVPIELETDPTAIKVTPRVLEVYFRNICNLACVYCSAVNSSVIEAEYNKFGPISSNPHYVKNFTSIHHEEYINEFWKWMELNSGHLKIFNVLGGEPLYHDEFDQCIEFFDKHPNPELTFGIFSNLKHDEHKFKDKINRIDKLISANKIKKFEIVCSIDCWGKESEYVRSGLDIINWEKNFETLVATKHVGIHVHMSATPMSVFTADQLITKVTSYRDTGKWIGVSMNTVVKPTCLSPYIFGHHLAEYLERCLDVIPNTEHDQNVFKPVTAGIINKMKNTEPDLIEVQNFVRYLDVLDFRRKKNWRAVFPVLSQLSNDLLNK